MSPRGGRTAGTANRFTAFTSSPREFRNHENNHEDHNRNYYRLTANRENR